MRIITIVCILLFVFEESSAQEQIKKGVFSLGGSIYYSSFTSKDENDEIDQSSYILIPSISYFLLDHFELSLSMNCSASTFKYNRVSYEYKSKSLGFGLGIRLYFPFGIISPFIGAGGQVLWSSYGDQTYSPPKTTSNITGGLEVFIAESAAIEPSITYSKVRYSEQYSIIGFQVGIGAKYFIL